MAEDVVAVLAFGPEALTGLARSLFEGGEMPAKRGRIYGAHFTADADELLRHSMELW